MKWNKPSLQVPERPEQFLASLGAGIAVFVALMAGCWLLLRLSLEPWVLLGRFFGGQLAPGRASVILICFVLSAAGFLTGLFRLRKKPSMGLFRIWGRLFLWTVLGGLLMGLVRFFFTPDHGLAALFQSLLISSGFALLPVLLAGSIFRLGKRITGNLHK